MNGLILYQNEYYSESGKIFGELINYMLLWDYKIKLIILMDELYYEDIEELVYVKKKFSEALDMIKTKYYLNKHKCNRDNKCDCIKNGKILIDIFMNSKIIDVEKIPIITYLNEFYLNPEINLPFDLFIYMCTNIIKLQNFSIARSLIGNYILYSNIVSNKEQYKPFTLYLDQVYISNKV